MLGASHQGMQRLHDWPPPFPRKGGRTDTEWLRTTGIHLSINCLAWRTTWITETLLPGMIFLELSWASPACWMNWLFHARLPLGKIHMGSQRPVTVQWGGGWALKETDLGASPVKKTLLVFRARTSLRGWLKCPLKEKPENWTMWMDYVSTIAGRGRWARRRGVIPMFLLLAVFSRKILANWTHSPTDTHHVWIV